MNKEARFCPFKKEVARTMRRGKGGELVTGYYDKFKSCAGERCMAYKNGDCLRLSGKEAQT